MAFEALLEEYEKRRAKALAMGGAEKLARRKAAGVLNARERVGLLLDPGTFLESGLFGASRHNSHDHRTAADFFPRIFPSTMNGFWIGAAAFRGRQSEARPPWTARASTRRS